MTQVSLVAFYGAKPKAFRDLLCRCIDAVRASPLQPYFQPYALEQIHATIVGMERAPGAAEFINANLLASTGRRVAMDFGPLPSNLQRYLPLSIRFGGFGAGDSRFRSAGRSPHERSFQVQWPTQRCTLIGWPHQNGNFTTWRLLNALRDQLAVECGLGHKYREDNDLFLVLGQLSSLDGVAPAALDHLQEAVTHVEERIRRMLAERPVNVVIDTADLSIVAYDDPTLPPASTAAFRLTEPRLDAAWIKNLYA